MSSAVRKPFYLRPPWNILFEISKLENEIDSLKDQIAQKKEQINVSTAILEETRKVRELLENTTSTQKISSEKDGSNKKTAKVSSIKENAGNQSITENEAVKMALEAQ